MMVAKAFVDTNIILRAFHESFPEHAQIRKLFDNLLNQDYELWISRQVIREYLVQTTHPKTFDTPLSLESVLAELNTIMKICHVADDTEVVTTKLLELLKEYPTRAKQIHDANLVATMLVNGIDSLLTLNIDDMKRFSDKITLISP